MALAVLSLSILSWLTGAAAQGLLNLTVHQSSVPQGASKPINPSFAGFGIEPTSLFAVMGTNTSNELSLNLLHNLAELTGHPPHIRVGGNTQDYMLYDENQTEYAWITNPNITGQGNIASDSILIGPKFFECANRFPNATPITWGLNLAYEESDYEQQLILMATALSKGIPNLNLVSMEIGNEPDLYLENGFRTGAWNGEIYLQQWLNRAQFLWTDVFEPLGLPSNIFEPGVTANTIGTSFTIADLDTMGAATIANGSQNTFVHSWNQHDYFYFIGVSTYPITLKILMTLSNTEVQFAAWVTQIQQADATPYPYALREMASVGPVGDAGVSDTFGATLWTLNFFFYAATLNITSVEMHMTLNSNASAWQPTYFYNRQPFVRPNYYAWAAFDQIIGPSCQAQITPLDVSAIAPAYADVVRAYRVDQAGTLATIVIINAQQLNSTANSQPQLTVALTLPATLAGEVLHLAYLNNTGADAMYNTTWNGISYEQFGDGTSSVVSDADETVTVGAGGTATLIVRDSQALAINIGAKVGSVEPNSVACAAFAGRSTGPVTQTPPSASVASTPGPSSKTSSASHTAATSANKTSSAWRPLRRTISLVDICIAMGLAIVL